MGSDQGTDPRSGFVEKLEKALVEWLGTGPMVPKDFEGQLDNFAADIARTACKHLPMDAGRSGIVPPDLANRIECAIKDAANGSSRSARNILVEHYSLMHRRYLRLIDLSRQSAREATWHWCKVVFFRTLTAVGIAAVVLATGWISHKYHIPLPMLRLPGT